MSDAESHQDNELDSDLIAIVAALQQCLNVADQRVDELEQALAAVTREAHRLTVNIHAEYGSTEHDSDCKEAVAALYAMSGITQPHTCCGSCPAGCTIGEKR
ncbi:hypothetical protein C4K14_2132 [Pseudomonas chlororaphis subsp. aureofaciens]|uniref:hypothetical protein n=1 Tax=Pseudomonas chlororaphis TaxID=587753 RepID=UPI000F5789F8|nr:hypothetical protein [Pseudomonas chlororaphis]AZD84966.1 hypothetical protein C4K14_2132 [Pseudomonas chlororaphis subsp. aureofaciens]